MKDKHGRHLAVGDAVMAEKDGFLFTVIEAIYLDERGCRNCAPQVERAAVRAVQDMDACGCVLTKLGPGVKEPEMESAAPSWRGVSLTDPRPEPTDTRALTRSSD